MDCHHPSTSIYVYSALFGCFLLCCWSWLYGSCILPWRMWQSVQYRSFPRSVFGVVEHSQKLQVIHHTFVVYIYIYIYIYIYRYSLPLPNRKVTHVENFLHFFPWWSTYTYISLEMVWVILATVTWAFIRVKWLFCLISLPRTDHLSQQWNYSFKNTDRKSANTCNGCLSNI